MFYNDDLVLKCTKKGVSFRQLRGGEGEGVVIPNYSSQMDLRFGDYKISEGKIQNKDGISDLYQSLHNVVLFRTITVEMHSAMQLKGN